MTKINEFFEATFVYTKDGDKCVDSIVSVVGEMNGTALLHTDIVDNREDRILKLTSADYDEYTLVHDLTSRMYRNSRKVNF